MLKERKKIEEKNPVAIYIYIYTHIYIYHSYCYKDIFFVHGHIGSQLPFLTFGGTDYVRTNFVPSYPDAISAVVTVNISGSAFPYINGSFPDIIARAAEIYVSLFLVNAAI